MQNGLLIALAFAVLIIVLAVVVTWLTRRGRPIAARVTAGPPRPGKA